MEYEIGYVIKGERGMKTERAVFSNIREVQKYLEEKHQAEIKILTITK